MEHKSKHTPIHTHTHTHKKKNGCKMKALTVPELDTSDFQTLYLARGADIQYYFDVYTLFDKLDANDDNTWSELFRCISNLYRDNDKLRKDNDKLRKEIACLNDKLSNAEHEMESMAVSCVAALGEDYTVGIDIENMFNPSPIRMAGQSVELNSHRDYRTDASKASSSWGSSGSMPSMRPHGPLPGGGTPQRTGSMLSMHPPGALPGGTPQRSGPMPPVALPGGGGAKDRADASWGSSGFDDVD
jgi:hypothetical protein